MSPVFWKCHRGAASSPPSCLGLSCGQGPAPCWNVFQLQLWQQLSGRGLRSDSAPRGRGKMLAHVSCVFLWLEQDVELDPPLPPTQVLHSQVLLGGSSCGMASPAGIPAWELGVGVGKPKIQPNSVVTLHHNCSTLLPYLMLNFWNYSPVSQVMFLLLREHSGCESAAFLGTATLGVLLPK